MKEEKKEMKKKTKIEDPISGNENTENALPFQTDPMRIQMNKQWNESIKSVVKINWMTTRYFQIVIEQNRKTK